MSRMIGLEDQEPGSAAPYDRALRAAQALYDAWKRSYERSLPAGQINHYQPDGMVVLRPGRSLLSELLHEITALRDVPRGTSPSLKKVLHAMCPCRNPRNFNGCFPVERGVCDCVRGWEYPGSEDTRCKWPVHTHIEGLG